MIPLKNREREFQTIDNWISSSIDNNTPLTVYISGSPGTGKLLKLPFNLIVSGKTATMRLILQKWKSIALSTILNCVSFKKQSDLIGALFASLEVQVSFKEIHRV